MKTLKKPIPNPLVSLCNDNGCGGDHDDYDDYDDDADADVDDDDDVDGNDGGVVRM